jgi:hypothetical protein
LPIINVNQFKRHGLALRYFTFNPSVFKVEQEIIINLIGTGYDVTIGFIPRDIEKLIGFKNETKDYYQLFDLDFYRTNKIVVDGSNNLMYSWKDINADKSYTGANFFERSQLEIWVNGKRKRTLKLADVFVENVLFQPYNIVEEELSSQQSSDSLLLIGHQLKGLIAKYEFKTPYFNMDFLEMDFLSFSHDKIDFKILHRLAYKGLVLKSELNDALVTGIIIKLI